MTRLRCVHLSDDFALGGVAKGLKVYQHPRLLELASSHVLAVKPGWSLAPRFDAHMIFTHFPPSWRTLPYFASLRWRNRRSQLVHVEHSYTRAWEALKVRRPARFRRVMRIVFGLCHEVVAVSHGQARWLTDIKAVPKAKLHVLHPFSGDQGLLDIPVAAPRADRPLQVYAYGRFAEAKGFDVLIDAIKQLDPDRFELTLGGVGVDEVDLRAQAAGCPNIRFAGRIDDIAGFLAQSDLVVVPSRWEAFGQVAAEARAAGRPIIVADIDGLAEQVGDCGFAVDCRDASHLAGMLSSLGVDQLTAMAHAARRSMQHAETDRTDAWRALFARAARRLGQAQFARPPGSQADDYQRRPEQIAQRLEVLPEAV